MYRKLFGLVIFLSFIFGGVFYTVPNNFVSAQEKKCDCYCTSPKGVKKAKSKTTSSFCEKVCRKKKEVVAVCAYSPKDNPSNSVSCFTEDQCKTYYPKDHKVFTSVFGKEQPSDCPAKYHRCYSKKKPGQGKVKLNIAIGKVKTVNDLGEYLPAMYKWLLGSGISIAVVLIMIGGLQYALGGMSQDQVAKAKKRISNAIIGLVLMISVVMILSVINPQLLKIEPPAMPLIKPLILASGQSCEYYQNELKYKKIGEPKTRDGKKGEKKCGSYSDLIKDEKGQDVADGISCAWSGCDDTGDKKLGPIRCLNGEKQDVCMRCGELYDGNSDILDAGITVSASVCDRFSTGTYDQGSAGSVTELCIFSKDGALNLGVGMNKVTKAGGCGWMTYMCGTGELTTSNQVTVKAITNCDSYESIPVYGVEGSAVNLESIDTEVGSAITCAGLCANMSLEKLCVSDPCNATDGPCRSPTNSECAAPPSSSGGNAWKNTCLAPGVPILMVDGSEKKVEDIVVGDMVQSWDEKTDKLVSGLVSRVGTPIYKDMVRVVFEHAEIVNTFDHPYYIVGKGWASYDPEKTKLRHSTLHNVEQLEVGDVALWYDAGELIESKVKVLHVEFGETQTYIFRVDKYNTFFADGILTHNK